MQKWKMNKWIVSLIIVACCYGFVFGEDGAPSMWYGPTNDSFTGDTIIRTIGIPYATMYTYYSTINWNAGMDGGGYCGLQEHPSGREYHFAIWDPSNHQAITPVYLSPGTTAQSFGGEGTGLKAMNFTLGWDTGQWYATAVRCWDVGSQDTYFGYWIHDVTGDEWTHILTFDFPMPDIRFSTGNGGFVEDWAGTGSNIRRCHIQGGSKRNLSGTWYGMSQCNISANPDTGGDYDWNFDGGVENDYYFIESGGTSTPGPAFGSGRSATFGKSQPNDPQDPAIAFSITAVTSTEVSWNVPVSSTPQFGYTIKINGDQVDSAIEPEIRTVSITANEGNTVEVILEDILGRTTSQSDTIGSPDTTPPTPDPMTWETEPYTTGQTSISMTATTASDPSGVEYYFTCTAGGGNDSNWQPSPAYTDTGLTPDTPYTYTVTACDNSPAQNQTAESTEKSATTGSASSPIGWWKLDETTGTTAFDFEYSNDGTLIGGVTFDNDSVTGVYGGALDLNGTDDSISLPAFNLNSNTVTITAWIKRNGTPSGWNAIVFSRDGSTVAGLNFGNSTELRYHWNDGNWGWDSGLNVPDAQWTFVALVVEPSQATIYMDDGTFQSSTNTASHAIEEFDGTVYIGRDVGNSTRYLDGAVDDVRIYSVVLSSGEIQNVRDNGGGEPDTTPPTPDPATFSSPPSADSSSSISMTATTGSDATGPVEYYFDETSGENGGTDSEWQTSPNYTDDGLDADTQYTYTVQMRDSVTPTPNTGTVSSPASATTDPAGGDTVIITKAEYKASKSELKVEATSSDGGSVTLTVVDYGDMTYDSRKDKHKYSGKPVANPGATVTVTSSGGGQDTRAVTQR